MERDVHGVEVRGVSVGPETRCDHYDGDRDVVALKFGCCETYYPCFRCHAATTDHATERLSVEQSQPAVLCGACGAELTPRAFVDGPHRCPDCGTAFNPGCADHYERYFAFPE
ncbi:hypothetical protein BRC82_00485 [Halobacteriales archaeon QS_1_67_19]|nr:MAG: hypothetical protein BRC82_00485 [Halobacteriales archaeon QS_1_67_19]